MIKIYGETWCRVAPSDNELKNLLHNVGDLSHCAHIQLLKSAGQEWRDGYYEGIALKFGGEAALIKTLVKLKPDQYLGKDGDWHLFTI